MSRILKFRCFVIDTNTGDEFFKGYTSYGEYISDEAIQEDIAKWINDCIGTWHSKDMDEVSEDD